MEKLRHIEKDGFRFYERFCLRLALNLEKG